MASTKRSAQGALKQNGTKENFGILGNRRHYCPVLHLTRIAQLTLLKICEITGFYDSALIRENTGQ